MDGFYVDLMKVENICWMMVVLDDEIVVICLFKCKIVYILFGKKIYIRD